MDGSFSGHGMTHLVGVPSADIDRIWGLVEGPIEEACLTSRGKFTAFDIGRMLRAAECQLWICWNDPEGLEAVVITEVISHPRKKVARIKICVGHHRPRWQHHLATIEAWAKANGCEGVELVARPGWSRVLKPMGYETTHLFLEKDI